MTIPIIGQGGKRELQCIACKSTLQPFPPGLICMKEECQRFGLVSAVGRDPILEEEQSREGAADGPVH